MGGGRLHDRLRPLRQSLGRPAVRLLGLLPLVPVRRALDHLGRAWLLSAGSNRVRRRDPSTRAGLAGADRLRGNFVASGLDQQSLDDGVSVPQHNWRPAMQPGPVFLDVPDRGGDVVLLGKGARLDGGPRLGLAWGLRSAERLGFDPVRSEVPLVLQAGSFDRPARRAPRRTVIAFAHSWTGLARRLRGVDLSYGIYLYHMPFVATLHYGGFVGTGWLWPVVLGVPVAT